METDEINPLSKPGSNADAYDVRERIAIGTGGVVYRAVERESDTEVLFKVLHPSEMAHPINVAYLLERRAELARVRHPNVARLLDVFDDDEGCVLVYNYLSGKGAQLCPKDSVLTQAEARAVAHQLCGALLAGEAADCPHGEIKPSNIIIARSSGRSPVVQLQDWGISACRKCEPPEESLLFMAPERLKGAAPDFQSDLFSVGATLVFLLSGHVPVQSSSREELLRAWSGFDIATLTPLRPDLEASFLQWIGWLMRLKPSDRPDTVEKACEVLDKVIAYGEALDKRDAKAAGAASGKTQAPNAAPQAPVKSQALQAPRTQPPAAPAPLAASRAPTPSAAPVRPTPKAVTPVPVAAPITAQSAPSPVPLKPQAPQVQPQNAVPMRPSPKAVTPAPVAAAPPIAAPSRPQTQPLQSAAPVAPSQNTMASAAPLAGPIAEEKAAPEPDSNKVFRWLFISFATGALIMLAAWVYDQRESISWPWGH